LGLLSLRERTSYIGGRLEIKSAPGQGSRFTLRVPVKIEATLQQVVPASAANEEKILQSAATIAKGKNVRVVFVDDHKVLRQGLIRLVSGKPNISVVGEAGNGIEALELAHRLRPDVVVMDVSMPQMDGIEATHRIKTELPDVHVLGLSMHEDENIAEAMRSAGAEAFLSKATSSEKLLDVIYEIAGQGQAVPTNPNAKKLTQLKLPL
jgi:CheY-like chemotaxis protein